MKLYGFHGHDHMLLSHPAGVRGLKLLGITPVCQPRPVAPRRGAWIETCARKGFKVVNSRRTPQGCVD